MKIRDRIKEFRRVPAGELIRNPENWKHHTEAQRDALRGVLVEIGFAGAALVRELEDGRLELIDGELRADEADSDQKIPCLVLDVDEDEAAMLLATFDPIGAMASANGDVLQGLLSQRQPQDAGLRELLDDLARGLEEPCPGGPGKRKKMAGRIDECEARREMHLRPHEHYDYVFVLARTTQEWNQLAERLGLEKIPQPREPQRFGWARGYPAAKLIALLDQAAGKKPPAKKKRK